MRNGIGLAVVLAIAAAACGRGEGDNTNSGVRSVGTESNGGNVAKGNMTSGNDRASLTGCLSSGEVAGTYTLRLASPADAPVPAGSAASATSTGGRAFIVVAESGEDLSKSLNKRVAVDGFIESAAAALNPGAGTPGAAAGSGVPPNRTSGVTATSGTTSQGPSATATTMPAATTPTTPPTATTGTTTSSGSVGVGTAINMQVIRARSVRQVAEDCLPAETGQIR